MCDTVDVALQDRVIVLFRGPIPHLIIKLHTNSHLHSDRHSMLRDTYAVFNYAGVKLSFVLSKSKFNVIDTHLRPRPKMQWYNIERVELEKRRLTIFCFTPYTKSKQKMCPTYARADNKNIERNNIQTDR